MDQEKLIKGIAEHNTVNSAFLKYCIEKENKESNHDTDSIKSVTLARCEELQKDWLKSQCAVTLKLALRNKLFIPFPENIWQAALPKLEYHLMHFERDGAQIAKDLIDELLKKHNSEQKQVEPQQPGEQLTAEAYSEFLKSFWGLLIKKSIVENKSRLEES